MIRRHISTPILRPTRLLPLLLAAALAVFAGGDVARGATVVETIDVGDFPLTVALTADGGEAWVTNYVDGTVSVIDTEDRTVSATIPVGGYPVWAAFTPDGARAYVTNSADDTVSVINTSTRGIAPVIPVGAKPEGLAISPDGGSVYVVNADSDTVSVIDTATNTVVATIIVDEYPIRVVVSPDGTRAYVTNTDSGTISVIDTTTNTVSEIINPGGQPYGLAISPDGERLYVTDRAADVLRVFSTASNDVVATVGVGSSPYGVAASPDGARVYVTSSGAVRLTTIDAATNTEISNMAAGLATPQGIAISADSAFAYVANVNTDSMSIVDLTEAPAITTATLPDGQTTDAYNEAVIATGYPEPTFSVTEGTFPPGLTLNGDGTIIGTPNSPGDYAFTVTATNPGGSHDQPYTVEITAVPVITTPALADGQVDATYNDAIVASGYPAPTFAVTAGTFPPGLTLDPGGVITGKPSTAGDYAFTVTATNTTGFHDQPYTMDIVAAPVFELPTPPPPVVVDAGGGVSVPVVNLVSVALDDEGGASASTSAPDGSEVSVSIPAGALPGEDAEGLSLEVAAIDDLSEATPPLPTPPDAGYLANFVVHLVDGNGDAVSGEFAEPVTLEFTVDASTLPEGAEGGSLVLVYWDGAMWVEVPATVALASDGTATLTAEVTHFTLFSVLHAPGWAAFAPTPSSTGVTLARWQGGGYDRLDVASAGAVWVAMDGRWLGYRAGAPSFVQMPFLAQFPDGLPAGTPVVITP